PESQLGDGWFDRGNLLRWTAPRAECDFYRPADAKQFEIYATVPVQSLAQDGPSRVTILEDGQSLGTSVLSQSPGQKLHWMLSAESSAGRKHITILAEPARHGVGDPRTLGIAILSLGYLPL